MKLVYKERSDVTVCTLPSGKIHQRPDGKVEIYLDSYEMDMLRSQAETNEMLSRVDSETDRAKESEVF